VATIIVPEDIYYGTPASLLVGGVEVGATVDPPTIAFEITHFTPEFQGARGPVARTRGISRVIPRANFQLNEFSASKLAWAFAGSTISASGALGFPDPAGLDTTLAADPAIAATNLKVTAITNVAINDFVLVGPTLTPTDSNTEVVRVLTVGTAGAGGTGLDIVSDTGGGMRIDHANGENVKEVFGTTLATPIAVGAGATSGTSIKLTAIPAGLTVGHLLRVGYFGRYESRTVTFVGTAGAGGTGVIVDQAYSLTHAAGEWVIRTSGLGLSSIEWTPGRLGSGVYKDCVLTGEGLDGRQLIVDIYNAINTSSPELTFADTEITGVPITLEGNYDPLTPRKVPFRLRAG